MQQPWVIDRRAFLAGATAIAVFGANASSGAAETAKLVAGDDPIPVAFALSSGANVIDTAGPWEVFQDTSYEKDGARKRGFKMYTVAPEIKVVRMTGGLSVMPDFTYADAPQPRVIVVPAQSGSPQLHEWLRRATEKVDVTMSVCTGAFQLGAAGLLKGLHATTHHDFYEQFAKQYPDVTLIRGKRFVDNGKIATAGGLTSGFDMALHVVERYYGSEAAARTARYMEYDHYSPTS